MHAEYLTPAIEDRALDVQLLLSLTARNIKRRQQTDALPTRFDIRASPTQQQTSIRSGPFDCHPPPMHLFDREEYGEIEYGGLPVNYVIHRGGSNMTLGMRARRCRFSNSVSSRDTLTCRKSERLN